MKKILGSMMLIAALTGSLITRTQAAPALPPIEEATPDRVEIDVHQRTETTGGIVVQYSMNGRNFQLTAIQGSSATTMRISEGGRQLLEVVGYRNGGGMLKNHRGATFSAEQMRKDPSLAAQFDPYAFGLLDMDVAKLVLVGNTTVPNPCVAHWALFIACGVGAYIAACVEWHCDGWSCEISGSC
jgi:hypothetical protein